MIFQLSWWTHAWWLALRQLGGLSSNPVRYSGTLSATPACTSLLTTDPSTDPLWEKNRPFLTRKWFCHYSSTHQTTQIWKDIREKDDSTRKVGVVWRVDKIVRQGLIHVVNDIQSLRRNHKIIIATKILYKSHHGELICTWTQTNFHYYYIINIYKKKLTSLCSVSHIK